jgi:hypothetical protein
MPLISNGLFRLSYFSLCIGILLAYEGELMKTTYDTFISFCFFFWQNIHKLFSAYVHNFFKIAYANSL